MRFRPSLARGAWFALIALVAWPLGVVRANEDAVGAPAATITIQSGLSDRDVAVDMGALVEFVNRDDDRHRLRSTSGPDGFDTGNLEPGESARIRLAEAGTYAFRDERNRGAAAYRGRIVVRSQATTGALARPGSTGVPDASGGVPVPGAGPGEGVATTATVTIADGVFLPATTTVTAGGVVTFTNADGDEHTATSVNAGGIDSGVMVSGGTYRKTFPAGGTFEFVCLIHSDMRGTIRVVAVGGRTDEAPAAANPAAPTTDPRALQVPSVTGDAERSIPPAGQAGGPSQPAAAGVATDVTTPAPEPAGPDGPGGFALAVILVSGAATLFAAAIRGTVRSVD
jgi:plastocyanin